MMQHPEWPSEDPQSQFIRTKTPRMHVMSVAESLFGLLYLPMTEQSATSIAQWYTQVSPMFSQDLPAKIGSLELPAAKFLSSLLQNHPDQRTGKEKRLDIGYDIRVEVDIQQQTLSQGSCGLLLTYPLQIRHQEIIAVVRAIYMVCPELPPAQFYCMRTVGLTAPVMISVSSQGVSLLDAEVDLFGPERLMHEQQLNCYVGHVLYQHPSSVSKIPATLLFKAGHLVDPRGAFIEALQSEYDGVKWSAPQNCFVLPDGTRIKIVRSERVSCYEYEMFRRLTK